MNSSQLTRGFPIGTAGLTPSGTFQPGLSYGDPRTAEPDAKPKYWELTKKTRNDTPNITPRIRTKCRRKISEFESSSEASTSDYPTLMAGRGQKRSLRQVALLGLILASCSGGPRWPTYRQSNDPPTVSVRMVSGFHYREDAASGQSWWWISNAASVLQLDTYSPVSDRVRISFRLEADPCGTTRQLTIELRDQVGEQRRSLTVTPDRQKTLEFWIQTSFTRPNQILMKLSGDSCRIPTDQREFYARLSALNVTT